MIELMLSSLAASCAPLFAVRYLLLSIYLFFSPAKWPFLYSLIASISACHSERCLPVASRFITVLIDIVSIPISSMAYYFSRSTLASD